MKQNDTLDLGSVQIHRKVLAEIINSAIESVDGVQLIQHNFSLKVSQFFKRNNFPGILIKEDDKHNVSLELKVFVRYGINIPDAARQIQTSVRAAVKKTVDLNFKDINIHIEGIERGQG